MQNIGKNEVDAKAETQVIGIGLSLKKSLAELSAIMDLQRELVLTLSALTSFTKNAEVEKYVEILGNIESALNSFSGQVYILSTEAIAEKGLSAVIQGQAHVISQALNIVEASLSHLTTISLLMAELSPFNQLPTRLPPDQALGAAINEEMNLVGASVAELGKLLGKLADGYHDAIQLQVNMGAEGLTFQRELLTAASGEMVKMLKTAGESYNSAVMMVPNGGAELFTLGFNTTSQVAGEMQSMLHKAGEGYVQAATMLPQGGGELFATTFNTGGQVAAEFVGFGYIAGASFNEATQLLPNAIGSLFARLFNYFIYDPSRGRDFRFVLKNRILGKEPKRYRDVLGERFRPYHQAAFQLLEIKEKGNQYRDSGATGKKVHAGQWVLFKEGGLAFVKSRPWTKTGRVRIVMANLVAQANVRRESLLFPVPELDGFKEEEVAKDKMSGNVVIIRALFPNKFVLAEDGAGLYLVTTPVLERLAHSRYIC